MARSTAKISRALEFVVGGEDANPRFTTVSAADGKWEVTADLSDWADLITGWHRQESGNCRYAGSDQC